MESSIYKDFLNLSDWGFSVHSKKNQENMFSLGLVLDGLVYLTKLHGPTISTTKSELYLGNTNAWYVQCDIIYFYNLF